ncbi:unnamed protein product, partial [Rotaria magnacalcarata]
REEIQESTSTIEQSSQSIILNQHLQQTTTEKSTNELIVEKQTETIVTNINENAEPSISGIQECKKFLGSNDEHQQAVKDQEAFEHTTTSREEIQESTSTIEQSSQSIILNQHLQQTTTEKS